MESEMHRGSSQLELEAAQYFKLDLSQLDLSSNQSDRSAHLTDNYNFQTNCRTSASLCHHSHADFERRHHHHHRHKNRPTHNMNRHQHGSGTETSRHHFSDRKRTLSSREKDLDDQQRNESASSRQNLNDARRGRRVKPINRASGNSNPAISQPRSTSDRKSFKPISPHKSKSSSVVPANQTADLRLNIGSTAHYNGSSTTSTNSLPSISSSPSVSPSIVCPHLSLDDLLEFREDSRNVSPHTIGLCSRCRLDPPPNVHSPLSPMFKPFAYGQRVSANKMNKSTGDLRSSGVSGRLVKQGISDQQVSRYTKSRSVSNLNRANLAKKQPNMRDDSLDFALDPRELRRLQMSPTVRNSVEFIRRNSIESGRVLRIYKNGEPFEKPLRVCIMRGEFANIDHLLDHINTRLLVPLGARYLFHLDGQLVYSVEELKHGSIYIVSGTRTLDYRTSKLLKDQQEKENQQQRTTNRHEKELVTPFGSSSSISKANYQNVSLSPTKNLQDQHRKFTRGNKSPAKINSSVSAEIVGKSVRPRTKTLCERSEVDDSVLRSCDSVNEAIETQEQPVTLLRAKSELSALPRKRKKNVTFMDTGRGSSPAINDNRLAAEENEDKVLLDEMESEKLNTLPKRVMKAAVDRQPAHRSQMNVKLTSISHAAPQQATQPVPLSNLKKELSTSSVGIQVSDSIDGFLIDLPVALPARGGDSNLRRNKTSRQQDGTKRTGKLQSDPKKRRQFVTITERQLSLDELNELKDLSQGDHHHEPTLEESQEEMKVSDTQDAGEGVEEPDVVPDRSQTISIGCDPQVDEGTQTTSAREEVARQPGDTSRLVTSSQTRLSQEDGRKTQLDEHWQYPGGQAASATPTERPVSQSGPNETMRAKVTTPTPSLSTAAGGGDEISLSMSYDTNSLADSQSIAARLPRKVPMKLPPKRRVEVSGKLFLGLHAPKRNFYLKWVNGFSINDLYPENSVNEQRLLRLDTKNERASPSAADGPDTYLTPAHSRRRVGASHTDEKSASDFKPSSRYHNWICHSRRHNELIYPAGSLVVLWCQWTNEQRFYSNHTSNVSSIALSTLDLDLAASAQVCELYDRPQISANIHLWSIGELNTLMIIEDEHLRTKFIFSLRLKNAKSSGCELSAAARDEKQLYLFTYKRRLELPSQIGEEERKVVEPKKSPKRIVDAREQLATNVSLRVNRVTQSNQIPLFIMRVPSTSFKTTGNGKQEQVENKFEPVICFGRRCFQIWSPDVRQQKLRLMQQDGKSARFTSLMTKTTCLCRLSPSELLLGDSEGNIALLATNLYTSNSLGDTPKRMPTKSTSTHDARDLKYGIETIVLLGPLASAAGSLNSNVNGDKSLAGITCLARVTGSLFMSADTSCAVRFWKIQQQVDKMRSSEETSIPTVKLSSDISSKGNGQIHCEQLASIALPHDLGFICTILVSNYNRSDSVVEFYIVSTCNTILFGSVKLQQSSKGQSIARASAQRDLLANSSLSVVYEGHETYASSLVTDFQLITRAQMVLNKLPKDYFYFTCSLDCRICKWNGKQLIWKSLLPSSCVSLAVHPNGFVLAVGSIDGTVYILDKVSGLLISYFALTPVCINCLAYSKDGTLLAAGCSNGSIFILPVYERGLKYKKVSIFQSPNAVVSLQFSVDNRYMLTSVTHASFQELILWDLPNFRYMRDNVKLIADKIRWFDSICSGSEDVRAIWENANLSTTQGQEESSTSQKSAQKRLSGLTSSGAGAFKRVEPRREIFVTNLSCHRLIKNEHQLGEVEPKEGNYVIASDTRGFLRLFSYPSYDIQQGFYAARISSSAVNCCRFLNTLSNNDEEPDYFVSSSLDGSICLWELK